MSLQGVFLQDFGIFRIDFLCHKILYLLCGTESEVGKLSPRTGRPKAESPKKYIIKARFDEETYNALIAYCDKHQLTVTEAIRLGIKKLLSEQK